MCDQEHRCLSRAGQLPLICGELHEGNSIALVIGRQDQDHY